MVRTDRKGRIGLAADAHLAENGSPWVRALINRRGFQETAGVAELAGGIFRGVAARNGEGLDLGHVRPVFRQGSPSPSGNSQPWQEIVGGHKPLNGALKGANTKTTQRGNFQRPVRHTHGRKWRWSELRRSSHGQNMPRERRSLAKNSPRFLKARIPWNVAERRHCMSCFTPHKQCQRGVKPKRS